VLFYPVKAGYFGPLLKWWKNSRLLYFTSLKKSWKKGSCFKDCNVFICIYSIV